jgi:hypothetical protein
MKNAYFIVLDGVNGDVTTSLCAAFNENETKLSASADGSALRVRSARSEMDLFKKAM